MTMQPMASPTSKPSLARSGVKRLIEVYVQFLLIGGLLFLSAGRLDWWAAWIYLLAYFVWTLGMTIWGLRHNPELLNERGKWDAGNVKRWDQLLVPLILIGMLLLFVVAGLDAGRFGWSQMPLAFQVVGAVGLVVESILVAWAMFANTYLSTVARIQSERGHQAVVTGPYRYVRHPMYIGNIIMGLSTPLMLGSWWALLPGSLISALFVVRTALEDRMLQAELPGYKEYAQRVRYRLLPGVW